MENLYRYIGKYPLRSPRVSREPPHCWCWLEPDDPILTHFDELMFMPVSLPEYDEARTVAENAARLQDWMRTVGGELPWYDEFRALGCCLKQVINAALDNPEVEEDLPDPEKLRGLTRHDVRQLLKRLSGSVEEAQPENGAIVKASAVEAMLGNDAREVLSVARSDQNADNRMRAICGIDRRFLGYKSTQWAELLDTSDGAIRKTAFWKVDRRKAIRGEGE